MRASTRTILAPIAAALLLGGCADYGYYDNGYGYNGYGYDGYAYNDYPGYYTGPTVGFGIGYSDWDRDRGGRWRGRDWRDRDHDRDWRDRH
jgi:hypothetical protein